MKEKMLWTVDHVDELTAKRVLEKRLQDIVNLDELQFGFIPGKGTVDAFFVLKKMEKYQEKEKSLYMKACDRVSKKVMEWAMKKKEIPEMIVKAVMSLY